MKAIVTFSYGSGSMYSAEVRYFEAETEEKLNENVGKFKDLHFSKSRVSILEVGEDLDEFGSQWTSSENI
jgi:hypothetical protein